LSALADDVDPAGASVQSARTPWPSLRFARARTRVTTFRGEAWPRVPRPGLSEGAEEVERELVGELAAAVNGGFPEDRLEVVLDGVFGDA